MALKTGKLPARPDAGVLKFADFINTSKLAAPPANFGHDHLAGNNWGMLANGDDPTNPDVTPVGDCAIADALHQHLLWNLEVGISIPLTPAAAIKNYSAVTGYIPGDPSTDQGTDIPTLLHHRLTNGLVDARGTTHKIGAAVALEPGNWEQLIYALFYFDGVTIGIQLPQQWEDAFGAGDFVWDGLDSPDFIGGHAITGVAFRDDMARPITWGTDEVGITESGYAMASDETYAILSDERLRNGVDINGFDKQKLIHALPQLRRIRGVNGELLSANDPHVDDDDHEEGLGD